MSNLKKDYTVSITNTPVLLSRLFGMFLSCLVWAVLALRVDCTIKRTLRWLHSPTVLSICCSVTCMISFGLVSSWCGHNVSTSLTLRYSAVRCPHLAAFFRTHLFVFFCCHALTVIKLSSKRHWSVFLHFSWVYSSHIYTFWSVRWQYCLLMSDVLFMSMYIAATYLLCVLFS